MGSIPFSGCLWFLCHDEIRMYGIVEMYTCSNTALGRKEKKDGFVFFIFKTPPLFFYYNFFVQTCVSDHSHRVLLSRPLTLLAHLCFLWYGMYGRQMDT
jgi:hypothetical protein